MEYSKDIVLGINCVGENGQAKFRKGKFLNFIKKYKIIATISVFCGILIMLDCVLMYGFVHMLQNYAIQI